MVHYRKVNEKAIDNLSLIRNITDILDKLVKFNYFTTLDLANVFHQIELMRSEGVIENLLKDLQNLIYIIYLDE